MALRAAYNGIRHMVCNGECKRNHLLFTGSLQDYEYGMRGIIATTIELSCCKHPPPITLNSFWQQYRNSLVQYALAALDYGEV